MKNVLIIADGSISKHFIAWLSKKRVAQNKYFVISYTENTIPEKMGGHITHYKIDPTSFSKMRYIMNEIKYSAIFIVMENMEDAIYSLKNILMVDSMARVLLVNQWDNDEIAKDEPNVTVLNKDELMAGYLYNHLPNVPVIAQNVGLGQGEIMEAHVPFGSTYAFRHVGSILQRKWKISAIYRDKKQIIPTNATMIKPDDTLLIIGKPIVLDGIYKTINKRIGLFPEPFGKNLYLILDFRYDRKKALDYLYESLYLLDKLENKSLLIRILYPNDFSIIDEIKSYETDNITVLTCYDEDNLKQLVEFDIQEYDIGLALNSITTFKSKDMKNTLYDLKKIVYIFGSKSLYDVKECIVLMSKKGKMESISATAFDISESLNLKFTLADFDPEGDFENNKTIVEHYEILSHILNAEINIVQEVANPIRKLMAMDDILQIAPFENGLTTSTLFNIISTKVQDFLLTRNRHAKLLVPFSQVE